MWRGLFSEFYGTCSFNLGSISISLVSYPNYSWIRAELGTFRFSLQSKNLKWSPISCPYGITVLWITGRWLGFWLNPHNMYYFATAQIPFWILFQEQCNACRPWLPAWIIDCSFSNFIVRLKVLLFVLAQVFMQSNFALEDPEIFNHVLPWNMVTQETKEGMREAPRNSAKLLQEKVWIMNLCMFLSHEPGVGKMSSGKLNRRQYCQFICETKIIIFDVCSQCWQIIKLLNGVIIPVCHYIDIVIPDILYHMEWPYHFSSLDWVG